MTARLVVAAGPSLRPQDREAFPQIDFVGPVASGDVMALLATDPTAIGIVDGVFRERLPVRHKEILWAISQGVTLYGAASIGALRAVELAPFGMIGVGSVFDAYQEGQTIRDADVALVHGPAVLGYPLLSVPIVDVMATLRSLASTKQLSHGATKTILAAALALHYSERTIDTLVACATDTTAEATRLRTLLTDAWVDRKRLDAVMLLRRMVTDAQARMKRLTQPPPPMTPPLRYLLKEPDLP